MLLAAIRLLHALFPGLHDHQDALHALVHDGIIDKIALLPRCHCGDIRVNGTVDTFGTRIVQR